MKIVSRQTLQNLIKHQLLEHYTKKINLLTEGINLTTDELTKSLNAILPDDSRNIFSEGKSGYYSATASELGHARTCLVLICLYELLNDHEITKILNQNSIEVDNNLKNAFNNVIRDFFKNINRDRDNNGNIKETITSFTQKIVTIKKQISKYFHENQNSIPDFIKFLLKQPAVLLGQLTIDKVFDAWHVAWPNSDNTVAVITNPVWEGTLKYENIVKPKIVEPLKYALNSLIPAFNKDVNPTTVTVDEQKQKKEAGEKEKKEQQKKELQDKIKAIGNISSKEYTNTALTLTQLYVYHVFLNAGGAINRQDPSVIYNVNPNIKSLINKIINNNSDIDLSTDQLKELQTNLYDIFWISENDINKIRTFTDLQALMRQKKKSVLDKINSITQQTPDAFKIKLFLKTLGTDIFTAIFDKLKTKKIGSYFAGVSLTLPDNKRVIAPYQIVNNDDVINIIGDYFSSTDFWETKINKISEFSNQISEFSNQIKKQQKALKDIDNNDNKKSQKSDGVVNQAKEDAKKENQTSSNSSTSSTAVATENSTDNPTVAGSAVVEDKNLQQTTSPVNDEVNNELENIFRVPQLNGGYGQLAQILTSSTLLKNYKSGNFKRGKYDKADSYGYIFMDDETMDKAANLYSAAIKTLSRKILLSPAVEKKIEVDLKDYKKIGSYLNEYFNKKMLLANEYLLIDGSVILYLALRVLEGLGLEATPFQKLHQRLVVNKDPVVIPHNIKITNLDDAIAKKVDLNKRISIDQMFQNRKAKNISTQKTEASPSQTNTSQEKTTPVEDDTKSLKRVKALITQLGGKMFKKDIEDDDLITRAANGQYSKGQLGSEIVHIADTVYRSANDFDFNEFEKKQLKLGLQNYFEQKLSNYNGTDTLIQTINHKINQF